MQIAITFAIVLCAIFACGIFLKNSTDCEPVPSSLLFCEVGLRLAESRRDVSAVEQFCGELAVSLNATVCYGSTETSLLVGLEPSAAVFELIIERAGNSSFSVWFSAGSSADWLSQREARLTKLTHSVLDAELSQSTLRPLSTVIQHWVTKR
jgi:hypothetical protein